ncbi:hypothetical protein [Paraburkholderia tropica]|uniref:hypothetical protein n=1 Tax=Paraburkholderia tropica TaxID=92647 RepID=UPI0007EC829F|nr:hypothetical protein [Paraburkholderia tropica]OBR46140.1 hypothetical protein A6456_37755 [Paraburkholderia tropica]
MLSPHELSTLMLVNEAPHRLESSRLDLDALRERRLVVVEMTEGGQSTTRLTPQGDEILNAIEKIRICRDRTHAARN